MRIIHLNNYYINYLILFKFHFFIFKSTSYPNYVSRTKVASQSCFATPGPPRHPSCLSARTPTRISRTTTTVPTSRYRSGVSSSQMGIRSPPTPCPSLPSSKAPRRTKLLIPFHIFSVFQNVWKNNNSNNLKFKIIYIWISTRSWKRSHTSSQNQNRYNSRQSQQQWCENLS